ncbi:MAG: hypothetical protein Q4F31_01525 [Eubacteriales bacterium]|nr:hypothetical protein [Eubacteriales bacterium]
MSGHGKKGIELFALESPYYLEGSPVLITRGALMMDRFSETLTVSLKLKNITDTKLVSCEVRLTLFDARGLPYEHELFYKYDGMSIPRGKEFGSRRVISLPDNLVRSFEISVTEVTFGDYTRWENDELYVPVDPMESLKAAFNSEEMAKQYAVRYGGDCEYLPRTTADIWYCTCGAVNHVSEERCYSCGRKRAALEDVNVRSLRRDSEARAKSEKVAAEAEKREKAKKARRGNLVLRICLIILPILLVGVLILATVPPFLERREAYAAAEAMLAEGRYDEAGEAFTALGNYSDAADRAALDVPYEKAMYIMQCAENYDASALPLVGLKAGDIGDQDLSMVLYAKAAEIFSSLNGYKESSDGIEAVNDAVEAYNEQQRLNAYNSACELLDSGAYLQAREAFLGMNGYKDSADLAVESLYRRAVSVLDFCEKYNVRHICMDISETSSEKTTVSLPGYVLADLGSDVVNILKSAFYEDGVDFFYEDDPGTSEGSAGIGFLPVCEAVAKEFEALGDYKDSKDLKNRAETAGDFTSEFYALLRSGDLDGAKNWLMTYDDEVPERDKVAGWVEAYAPYRRYWKLYGGDNTVIPYSIGLTDGQRLNEFSSKVCIEGGKAILHLEQPDGEYVATLECEAGNTDFSVCPDGSNYYYGRINQSNHFIYMRYLENGKMLTSCEYYG